MYSVRVAFVPFTDGFRVPDEFKQTRRWAAATLISYNSSVLHHSSLKPPKEQVQQSKNEVFAPIFRSLQAGWCADAYIRSEMLCSGQRTCVGGNAWSHLNVSVQ